MSNGKPRSYDPLELYGDSHHDYEQTRKAGDHMTGHASNQDKALDHTDSSVPTVEESTEILSLVSKRLSDHMTHGLVHLSNNPTPQEALTNELLPTYFSPHNLHTPLAVVVNVLLHYFVLQRENQDLNEGRQAFEDLVQNLKEKIDSYERELKQRANSRRGGRDVERLQSELSVLQEENTRLQSSYDEVCHVNHQWALDYETLQQQISATKLTGFSSFSNSTQVGVASSHCHGILMSPSSEQHQGSCFECHAMASRLKASQDECESLRAEARGLAESRDRVARERDHLKSENKAIQYQLQELGDLRQAMAIKEDYTRKQQELKNLKKQNQEEVCARIKLEKQVEKLRQVFMQMFPFTAASNSAPYPTGGRGYATYPSHLRPCRVQQQYYSDPGPPTPPGLIARGQLASLVERDDQSFSLSQRNQRPKDEQVTGFENPLIRLETSREAPPHSWHGLRSDNQERSVSAPLLTANKDSKLVNGHTFPTLAPPTKLVTLRTHSLGKTRPRSLFDDRTSVTDSISVESTSLVRSLVDLNGHQIDQSNSFSRYSPSTHHTHSSGYTSESLDCDQRVGTQFENCTEDKLPRSAINISSVGKALVGETNDENQLKCTFCSKPFQRSSDGFDQWFDHIRFCCM